MYLDAVSIICGTALVVVLFAVLLRRSPEIRLRLWRYRPDDRPSHNAVIDDEDGSRAAWTLWRPSDADSQRDESTSQAPHANHRASARTSRE